MKKLTPFLLCVTLSAGLEAAQLPIVLGSAGNFSVLGASTVTNTGPTTVVGELGVSPGTAITGFPPGQVTSGSIHSADGPAGLAQGDLTTAYNDAAGRVIPAIVAGDLGGLTLPPGLYKSTSTLGITGVLRLDGQGNVNSVFIFQVGSALTTASGSQIVLQGGAQAANIFWQVGSSATLGTNSIFNGSILAQASISLATGAALNGRALARTAAVTLDSNTIVNPGPPTTALPPPALTVTCPSSVAQVGVAYNSILVATGGTPPYAFSTTTALPAGLILNPATGAIFGTPIAAGTTNFAANSADSASGAATRLCSIVTAAAILPVPTLNVTCPVGPAQVGVAYNSLLVATGGSPPYSFSTTGLLPAGLVLNATTGAVTGTPTTASTTSFSANASDAGSRSTTQSCSLTISPVVPPPPQPPSPTPAPSSLILVLIALSCAAIYQYRDRLLTLFRNS
ncbi:MAG: ice-binding family protein [Acidobacteriota bacterium]|nr:ice-binding family protein [Acidobacteriota bacterium]